MTRYNNRDSGINAYEIGGDYITVSFKKSGIYRYTYATAGREAVEAMKKLAISGKGLNTYINTYHPVFL